MADPNLVTTGTTITSTWGNAIANRVINIFSSVGGRSSAMASPFAGQTTAITSNDSAEGLYVYNSAGKWAKPWADAWGVMAYVQSTSSTGATTTSATLVSAGALTFLANRRILIEGYCVAASTGGVQVLVGQILEGATQKIQHPQTAPNTSDGFTLNPKVVLSPTAGSHTYDLAVAPATGFNWVTSASATSPTWICVTDLGPAGAPA